MRVAGGSVGPLSRGYLFVDFFFLLSGCVLTLAAQAGVNASRGALRFLVARVARLWPVIAIGALTGALLRTLETGQSVRMQLLQALLLVPDVRHRGGLFVPLNGPHRSMMLDVTAELAHATVIRRRSDRAVLALAPLGSIALATAIDLFGSATFGPDQANWGLGLAPIGVSYPIGVWLARRWKQQRLRSKMPWLLALGVPLAAVIAPLALPFAYRMERCGAGHPRLCAAGVVRRRSRASRLGEPLAAWRRALCRSRSARCICRSSNTSPACICPGRPGWAPCPPAGSRRRWWRKSRHWRARVLARRLGPRPAASAR